MRPLSAAFLLALSLLAPRESLASEAPETSPPAVAAPDNTCKVSSRWATVGQVGALGTGIASLTLGTAVGLDLGRLPNAAAPLYDVGTIATAVGLPVMAVGGVGMFLGAKSCGNVHARIGGGAFVLSSALAVPAALAGYPAVRACVDAAIQNRTGAATANGAVALTIFAVPLTAMFVGLRQVGQMRNARVVPVGVDGRPGLTIAGVF